jgi:hypothetical protein
MHKNTTKCNETLSKWCKNKHGASKLMDTLETYHSHRSDNRLGCVRLSFLDAYFGYNQTKLKKEDEKKTAFITPYGVFCYQVMPFGLKNAGATYQRMMENCFESQIGCNIQVYIDNVVITTRKEESLISDLAETFDNLNMYKLKFNLTKCSFDVSVGQLLGFLVLARGIEVNPEKIQAILTMGKPTKLHNVQKLVKGICPRGNNKVVIIIFHVYDKCLFLMLELY